MTFDANLPVGITRDHIACRVTNPAIGVVKKIPIGQGLSWCGPRDRRGRVPSPQGLAFVVIPHQCWTCGPIVRFPLLTRT
jgi:hypothetical protein